MQPLERVRGGVRTGGIERGTASSQNHENKIMASRPHVGGESASGSVEGEQEQEHEQEAGGEGGHQGAGAVPPSQGRCLLMILHI
jgi:hypothetical protein